MPLIIAYCTVILIWATTPLTIVWSSTAVSPTLALLLRMLIAFILGWVMLKALRIKFPYHPKAIRLYCYSAIGVVGGMLLTYLAARSVSSGLISLMFGLTPMLSGLFSQKFLDEKPFTFIKKLALGLAFIGLFIIFYDNLLVTHDANSSTNFRGYLNVVYVILAVILFSLSGVLVKSVEINIHPLATTMGTLTIAIPCYILAWYLHDGVFTLPELHTKAFWSIIYLGIFASLFGFIAYFYVLQRLAASTMSLIMLITPIIAVMLGNIFNHEVISSQLIVGAACIVFSLVLYFFGHLIKKPKN